MFVPSLSWQNVRFISLRMLLTRRMSNVQRQTTGAVLQCYLEYTPETPHYQRRHTGRSFFLPIHLTGLTYVYLNLVVSSCTGARVNLAAALVASNATHERDKNPIVSLTLRLFFQSSFVAKCAAMPSRGHLSLAQRVCVALTERTVMILLPFRLSIIPSPSRSVITTTGG